jgi:RLL motif-containing protein 1
MFRRKLDALKFPHADSFNSNDELKVRNLVVWLEDLKIRHYKVEERDILRNLESPVWPTFLEKYLRDVGMPFETKNINEILDWLLSYAVRLEYSDNVQEFSKITSDLINEQRRRAPTVETVNPLDKFDFSSPEFVNGVNALADQLEITKHPNHLITFEAIAILVKTRMSKKIRADLNKLRPKGKPYPVLDSDMGFDSADEVLNQAAKILRLLYIHDLRELQTKINECIVQVQALTSNPKTDTKLGKVGF